MTFHRVMTRTILENSLPENLLLKFPEKCKKTLTWCVIQFWTICLVLNEKHMLRSVNFSEGCRVVCSLTQTNSPP